MTLPVQAKSILDPPVFEDEEQTRAAALLHTILLTIFALMVVFTAAQVLSDRLNQLDLIVVIAGVILTLPPWWMLRSGRLSWARRYLSVGLLVATTMGGIAYGGIGAPIVVSYFIVVLVAALLLGDSAALVFAALSILTAFGLVAANLRGWLFLRPPIMIDEWAISAALLVFAAVLLRLAMRAINAAFERARRHEQELTLANQKLAGSERRFRALIENSHDGLTLFAADGTVVYVSPSNKKLLGYDEREVVGRNRLQFVHPEDLTDVRRLFQDLVRSPGASLVTIFRLLHKDGTWRWIEAVMSNLLAEPGVQAIAVNYRDITERRLAEMARRESEDRFTKAFHDSPIATSISSLTRGIFLDVNQRFLQVTGYERSEVIGHTSLELKLWMNPEDREEVGRAARERQTVEEMEGKLRTKSGNVRDVIGSFTPIELGGDLCVLSMAYDITARKHAEMALQRLNRAYRVVSGCNQILVRATDETNLLDEVCRILVEVGGYKLAWIGFSGENAAKTIRPVMQFGAGDGYVEMLHLSLDDPDSATARTIHTGQPEVRQNLQDWTAIPRYAEAVRRGFASFIALPISNDNQTFGALTVYAAEPNAFASEEVELLSELAGDLGFGIATLRTREANRRAEEQLHYQANLLENVSDAVVSTDAHWNILSWNKAAEHIYGWRAEEVIGKPSTVILQTEYTGTSREDMTASFLKEGKWSSEVIQRRKDGDPIDVFASVTALRDAQGSVTGSVAINRDITERKEAERLRLEMEEQRELMALKEEFISMVSHEFRTPLTVIVSSAEILERYRDRLTPERQLDHLHKIQRQAKDMTDMMQEMLTLNKARAGKLTFNPMLMDVEEFCRAVFDQVRMTSDSPRNFVFKVHTPVGSALIDEKLLQHILLNLFSNAVKYSPEQGEIRFELWEQDSTLHFQISDQGMGIPESDQARLFEPFFRARNIGQIHGTGLGLAIVKESVTVHGGEIDFHSVEGQGTTFTVRLPKRTM